MPKPLVEDVAKHLEAAQKAFRKADFTEVLLQYRAVLRLDPEHGLANYWLGVLAMKASHFPEAASYLRVAARRLSRSPEAHIDLGLALRALGQSEESEQCFQKARVLAPRYAESQLNLALQLLKHKRLNEAIEACQRGLTVFPQHLGLLQKLSSLWIRQKKWFEALQMWRDVIAALPSSVEAHVAFGQSCYEAAEFELALEAFRRALEFKPDCVGAHVNLGLTFQKLGQPEQALASFGQALDLNPGNSEILKGLGDVFRDLRRWPEAIAAWKQAVERRPENADAWQNLGLGYEQENQLEEALACHERVLQLRPRNATALRYLGMIHQDLGHLDEAKARYQQALELSPKDPEVHWQIFSLMAARGEFPQAWPEYEWRWSKKRATPKREFKQPRWNGEPLDGRTILLHAEQGFGDTIQAVRYVPLVLAQGGRVQLWSPPELVTLLQTVSCVEHVFSGLSHEVQFDVHLPLMSLPMVFGTTLQTIPRRVPYLSVPPGAKLRVPDSAGKFKAGLVWSGSLSQTNDRRPIPLECLAPLLGMDGIQFYSLQTGRAGCDLARCDTAGRVIDLSSSLTDFGESAAAVVQMDLIITIDTAMAHLAGALGKPVWVLLSFAPDWRWLLDCEESPWYPSMRLFRQARPDSWPEVVARVQSALLTELSRHSIGKTKKSRTDPSILLGQALVHHQAGRLDQAEHLYRDILGGHPQHVEAMRLLGVAYRHMSKLEPSLRCLQEAVSIEPASALAHHDLGLTWFESGQLDSAIASFQRAVSLQPSFPEAHYHLGNALYRLKRHSEAETHYRSAAEQDPAMAEAWYNLGLISQDQRKFSEAIVHYDRALASNPAHSDSLLNAALVQKEIGKERLAVDNLRRLLKIDPAHVKAKINLASWLANQDAHQDAEKLCREVISSTPSLPEAWLNLGVIHQAQGRVEEAIADFQRALEYRPGFPDAEYNLGIAELLTGNYACGWKHYEARWRTNNPIFSPRSWPQPLWQGEPLKGRTILVHAEQGFGDAIQFVRFIPLLAEQGAAVLLECPQSLKRLLGAVKGVRHVIGRGDPVPKADYQVPLMSLPHRLGCTLESLPRKVPYLTPRPEPGLEWPRGPSGKLNVGLVWAGRPGHENDRNRSIPVSQLAPLCEIAAWRIYSLQVGETQARDLPAFQEIVDLAPQLRDFAVTASVIARLDLVVCVDTAVAHLAGALAKPVWVLLPFAPDWRWLLGREDSPWYPTMRLFRQETPGDWRSVIEKVQNKCQS